MLNLTVSSVSHNKNVALKTGNTYQAKLERGTSCLWTPCLMIQMYTLFFCFLFRDSFGILLILFLSFLFLQIGLQKPILLVIKLHDRRCFLVLFKSTRCSRHQWFQFFISDAFIFFPSYKVMRVAPQSDEEVSSLRDLLQSRKDVSFG